jgi:hypothetical protein
VFNGRLGGRIIQSLAKAGAAGRKLMAQAAASAATL